MKASLRVIRSTGGGIALRGRLPHYDIVLA
jgi:hypothetical protein